MVVQPLVCRTQYDKIITSINGAKAAGIETLAGSVAAPAPAPALALALALALAAALPLNPSLCARACTIVSHFEFVENK